MSNGEAEIKTRVVYLRDDEGHVVASIQNGFLVLQNRKDRTRYISFKLDDVQAIAQSQRESE